MLTITSCGPKPRSVGFSLIEIMIVLAIAAAVTAFAVNYLDAERRRAGRAQVIADQAQDMATIGSALESYLATKPAAVPADGSAVAITAKTLSDLGFLPPRFAVRNNDPADFVATSPLGQAYVIKARQVSGKFVGAVYTTGQPSIDQLAVFGMKATDEAFKEHNTSVMRRLKSVHYAAAGVVLKNQADTSSAVSGFSESLLPYEANVFADSNIVLLAGHSEYRSTPPIEVTVTEGGGGGGSTPAGGVNTEGRSCYMNTTTGECNAGYEKVWSYTACERWGPEYMSEPANTTVSIGGSTLTINKTLQSSGNTYRFPATSTVTSSNYWQSPSQSSGGGYYDAACPGSYTFYSTYCGSTSTYSWDMYCNYNGTWRTTPPTPGAWCSDNYAYKASTSTSYSSGISPSVAAIAAYGPNLTLPDNNLTVTPAEALTATAAQTIPVCAGSTNAVPLTVSRITGSYNGSAWREYVATSVGSAYSNVSYREQVLYTPASINVTATCVTRTVSNASSINLAPGVTAVNGCATQSPPNYQSYKSHQLFEYRLPAANRQKFAFCCAPAT